MLTDLGIKRSSKKDGRQYYLPLHARLSLLPEKFSELRDMLSAIKWIGNAGSHANNDVGMDDVLDIYELLEHGLQELYAKRTAKTKSLAKAINKNKGSAKKSRSK